MLNMLLVLTEPINIMTLALVTVSAGTIGLLSKYKIFLIFSIGGYITLIQIFKDYEGLVVGLIGVIIFNLWYATLGGRK
jgi:hypothetical protein